MVKLELPDTGDGVKRFQIFPEWSAEDEARMEEIRSILELVKDGYNADQWALKQEWETLWHKGSAFSYPPPQARFAPFEGSIAAFVGPVVEPARKR